MKRQIRRGVFETNSSSVHSLTMCPKADYDKWENGELWFDGNKKKFIEPFDLEEKYAVDLYGYGDEYSKDELVSEFLRDDGIYRNEEEYIDRHNEYTETFVDFYTTPGGEEIVAFGYSGYDG